MKNKILVKLFAMMAQSKGLPALENTVTTILSNLRDESKGPRDVVKLIISDFTMTQKILKLVNSVMYSPFARDVSSVTDAINIIGNDALNHVVLSVALISATDLAENSELSKTLLASEVARAVASKDRLEEASVASLLINLGTLMTSKFLPEYMQKIQHCVEGGLSQEDAEHQVLGMSVMDIGIVVAKRWNLPTSIISILDGTGDQELIKIAKFASETSTLVHKGNFEGASHLAAAYDNGEQDKSKLFALLHHQAEIFITIKAMNDEEIAVERDLNNLLTTIKSQTFSSVSQLAQTVFKVFNEVLKTSHCLLLTKTLNDTFEVKAADGGNAGLIQLRLKIAAVYQPTAFHAVIKNNVDIVIGDVSKLKNNSLPDNYLQLFPNVKKFIIMPIFDNGVTGLLYYDWEEIHSISKETLELIRSIRDVFVTYMHRGK